MTTKYLLRMGNGNDGNFPHAVIEMGEKDCPYVFMEMVIPNLFIAGHRARSHCYQNVTVDGEAEYGIYATLHEGHLGQQDMGAAYKTASLFTLTDDSYDDLGICEVKEYLDRGTLIKYNQKLRKEGVA